MEKLYAAGAGLRVAERGGHTALHLACRMRAHACARVLLQPRPRCARGAPNTYLAQGPDRTSDADRLPVASYPDPDSEKEDDESEEDWKLQLEAENYEGEGFSGTGQGSGSQAEREFLALGSVLLTQDPAPWGIIPRLQEPRHWEGSPLEPQITETWACGTRNPDHVGPRPVTHRPGATKIQLLGPACPA